MKKFFTLIAAALIGTSAFADVTYHSMGAKLSGAPFEYLNISNAIVGGQKTTAGATGKYGISADYPWIVYNYSASTLENGNAEVSRGGIWVSYNPMWMTQEFAYMVDDAQTWSGSPKFELGYTKGETYLNKLCPKSMTFNVKDVTRVDFLLTGGGSNTNDADIIVKKADGTVVKTVYVEPMAGKSNKNAAANTNSKWAVVDGLDAAESYQITVAPSTKNAQLQVEVMDELEQTTKVYKPVTEVLGADVNFAQDIELAADKKVCNVKAGAVYVAALHIFGTDLTVNGKKAVAPISGTYYSPVGNKVAGTGFAYVNISNALQNGVDTLTTFDASGNASHFGKYSVNDNYPWIYYNYTASVLDGKYNAKTYKINAGKCEVSRGGYYSSIEPITGKQQFTYISDDNNPCQWLGSPKAEMGYAKGTTYLSELNPKSVTFNVKETKKVEILLTGAGSNTNDADVVVKEADGTYVKTVYVEPMAGKSNKAAAANTNSKWGVVDGLDVAKSYQITVAPSIKNAKLNVSVMDELEQEQKVDTPAVKILGADANFAKDIALTADQKVNNVKAGTVAVLGIRIYGTDDTADNTIKGLVASAIKDGKKELVLNKEIEYTLGDTAKVDYTEFTIKGNGATITASGKGQIQTKKSLTIDNVVIDASASTVAPIGMAPKADMATAADTTACYTFTKDETGAYTVAKYENAANKCFEAQLVSITNSTIKSATSFITGGDAPWALRKLNVDNCIISTTATSGKAFLNWEEGAAQIKDIVISNSTLYGTDQKTAQRFHRYSAQVDPWRIWGYATGTDKNAAGLNTWTFTNNTIVNLCGNKEFSNNIKNTAATKFVFQNNVFANTWRLQKLGSNVTRSFEYTDNVICGGVNAVDGTDNTKWAKEEAAEVLGVCVADGTSNFVPSKYSIATRDKMGDPRWVAKMEAYVDAMVALKDSCDKVQEYSKTHTLEQKSYAAKEFVAMVSEKIKATNEVLNKYTAPYSAEAIKAAVNELETIKSLIEAYLAKIKEMPTAISTINAETPAINNDRAYNVAGQRVNANAKGIVIINGKKYFNR